MVTFVYCLWLAAPVSSSRVESGERERPETSQITERVYGPDGPKWYGLRYGVAKKRRSAPRWCDNPEWLKWVSVTAYPHREASKTDGRTVGRTDDITALCKASCGKNGTDHKWEREWEELEMKGKKWRPQWNCLQAHNVSTMEATPLMVLSGVYSRQSYFHNVTRRRLTAIFQSSCTGTWRSFYTATISATQQW